jgi:hypothetical protein
MGSGNKFRVSWMSNQFMRLGVSVGRMSEHEWSIHVDLIKFSIYIGIGKGYEEFSH